MVRKLDDFAHDVPATPLTTSRDQFTEQRLLALDVVGRPGGVQDRRRVAAIRDRYGRTTFGQSCLLARRLIEAGVSFITLNDRGSRPARLGHARAEFPDDQEHPGPPLGQGCRRAARATSPIADCSTTRLVVMMGEFGRTPKINRNAGRDHHGRANSVLMFGAGMPAGLVLGRTDATGDSPAERPVTPADLASVLLPAAGHRPRHQVRGARRPPDSIG